MNKERIEQQNKYRHELKYICRDEELRIIEQKIAPIMKLDPHTNSRGEYLIRSLYFDDYQYSCFYDNENGTDPREKYRIRAYNYSKEKITLEKKRKRNGMTWKDVCVIDQAVYEEMAIRSITGLSICSQDGHSLLNEWIVQNKTQCLRPVMLGEYIRTPYIFHLGNVRVTFDRNICVSMQTDKMFEKDISRISILPTGYHILEVKWDDLLPDVIYQLIEDGHMIQTTFSKFYLGCKALKGYCYEF